MICCKPSEHCCQRLSAKSSAWSRPLKPGLTPWSMHRTSTTRAVESYAVSMDILPPIQTQPQDTTCWCHTHCASQENHFVQASWLEAGWDRWHKISQRPRLAQTHSLPDWSSLDANGLWAPGYSSRGPCWPCTVLQASPHSTEVPVELRHLHHHCPKGGKINTPPVLKLFLFFFFHVFLWIFHWFLWFFS